MSKYLIIFHDPTEDLQVHRFILSTSTHVMTYNDYSTAESTHIEAIPELEQSAKGVDVHLHPFATVIALLVSVYSPTFQLHFFFFFNFFIPFSTQFVIFTFSSRSHFHIFISFHFHSRSLVQFVLVYLVNNTCHTQHAARDVRVHYDSIAGQKKNCEKSAKRAVSGEQSQGTCDCTLKNSGQHIHSSKKSYSQSRKKDMLER